MNEKPKKLIPETAAKRLLAGDVEMLAAAFTHGLDGSEVWPDTHLPLAIGILWHCPERVDEMLHILQGKGLLDQAAMPIQVEAQVAGCWRVHPERIESRLAGMQWLADNGDQNTAQRLVEASIGAGFPQGVAAFWGGLPKSQHDAALRMALTMDEPKTLGVMMGLGVDIQNPAIQARVLKDFAEEGRVREGARIANLIMQAKTGEPQQPQAAPLRF